MLKVSLWEKNSENSDSSERERETEKYDSWKGYYIFLNKLKYLRDISCGLFFLESMWSFGEWGGNICVWQEGSIGLIGQYSSPAGLSPIEIRKEQKGLSVEQLVGCEEYLILVVSFGKF